MYDLILKKRNGGALTDQEIKFFIQNFSDGHVPDYQASALMMATYFSGMSDEETFSMTKAMIESGDTIDLSAISGIKVDKHSTGGVGDKTSIVLAPLVAAAGVPVAKLSGRGLGHTGGTLDKLEAFYGFSSHLSEPDFIESVNRIGIAIAGQTANLCPADKKLYALRDVTATIESVPFIVGSIMSKKLSSGSDAIVLDVKTGSGAFMKTKEDAFTLAEKLVDVGERMGKRIVAVVTEMEQPLGNTIGNALEVREAIETLQGNGPKDLNDLVIYLGSHMLVLGGKVQKFGEGKRKLEELMTNGLGLQKLKELIENQGGDANMVDHPELLPAANFTENIVAPLTGFVSGIVAEEIGMASMLVGAGRETKTSEIDLSAGIELHKKVGEQVEAGEALATIHHDGNRDIKSATKQVENAYSISTERIEQNPLIYGVVDHNGVNML